MSLAYQGVFDIECADWDRFIVGGLYEKEGGYREFWSEDEMATSLLRREGIYYAHNGGKYDLLWLLDHAMRRDLKWTARMRGAGALSCKIGKLEVRDSYALIPMALKDCAPIGGMDKSPLRLTCDCGPPDCGGYCRLGRLTPAEEKLVSEYLETDCRSTAAMLDRLGERAAEDEIMLRLTVGSSAWHTAKTWDDLPACGYSLATYHAIREGYYGGRCEVHRAIGDGGHRHDIHASYPAALSRVALPCGTPRSLSGKAASRAFESDAPGMFWGTVYVPECAVPPLPARVKERLLYPWGPITGAWSRITLENALENGARLKRITRAYVWPREEKILKPYAERVWALRARNAWGGTKKELKEASASARADNAYAKWLKWLANSLTGKCAQRPENMTLHFLPFGEQVNHDMEMVRQTSRGSFYVTRNERVDACAHVIWSQYLTSEAHKKLYRGLIETPNPWYCDTDSVYGREKMTRDVGPELGQWGYEGEANEWRALAPKVYCYRDEKGDYHVRGKGMSGLDADGFAALGFGAGWTIDRGVDGIRTRIQKGLRTDTDGEEKMFSRRLLSRKLHGTPGFIGGRHLLPDGRTRAVTLAEWNER